MFAATFCREHPGHGPFAEHVALALELRDRAKDGVKLRRGGCGVDVVRRDSLRDARSRSDTSLSVCIGSVVWTEC